MSIKVAVLFSGQIRNIDPIIFNSGLKVFLNGIDADIYISTWDQSGQSGNHKKHILLSDKNTGVDVKSYLDTAFSGFLPKKTSILKREVLREKSSPEIMEIMDSKAYSYMTLNSVAQLFQIKNCYDLVEQKDSYDFFVRARFDALFVAPLKLELGNLEQDYVYHINFGRAYFPNRIYDIFFIASRKSSKVFSDAYEKVGSSVQSKFYNGLDARDACRILFICLSDLGLKEKSLAFRYCDVYRNSPRYFFDLLVWYPFRKPSLRYLTSYIKLVLKHAIN